MAHSITNIDNFSSDNELFWKVLKKKKINRRKTCKMSAISPVNLNG